MLIRSAERKIGLLTRIFRTKGSLWFPEYDHMVPRHQNVLAILRRPEGYQVIPASNIVTNAGDIHYAQRAVAETLTNAFGVHMMATAGSPGKANNLGNFTQIAASEKATAGSYPTRDDQDADNTGAGVDIVTHLVDYTKEDFNATGITHGLITNAAATGSDPILTGYAFAASFDKTADDTLKVFVNHEFLGS
jgi:hypothetical protein